MHQTFSQRSVGVTSEAETTVRLTSVVSLKCKNKISKMSLTCTKMETNKMGDEKASYRLFLVISKAFCTPTYMP